MRVLGDEDEGESVKEVEKKRGKEGGYDLRRRRKTQRRENDSSRL